MNKANTDLRLSLRRHRLLAILRGVPAEQAPTLIETLRRAGVELFEIALSDEHGLAGLRAVRAAFGKELHLGAGTIIDLERAQQARGAGATFLVTPHLVPTVAHYAQEHDLGYLSGALSPTEISAALDQGSAAVKVFPAGPLGPEYLRQLRGPYPDLPLIAVGGIDALNVRAFLKAGADGVGVGGALIRTDWADPDWAGLETRARQFVALLEKP
jgi:2-dehydro-3-deoxyphosphogluconate aldolase / (4S)-4-hydroxy-2-oxoglutarate aldolase